MIATSARATSETTSRPRSRRECLPAEPPRPPSCSVSLTPARAVCQAGAMPEITQASTQSSRVKAKMSPFILISSAIGKLVAGTR